MAMLLNRIIASIIGAPRVTHPDGKVFARINDHWLPIYPFALQPSGRRASSSKQAAIRNAQGRNAV